MAFLTFIFIIMAFCGAVVIIVHQKEARENRCMLRETMDMLTAAQDRAQQKQSVIDILQTRLDAAIRERDEYQAMVDEAHSRIRRMGQAWGFLDGEAGDDASGNLRQAPCAD